LLSPDEIRFWIDRALMITVAAMSSSAELAVQFGPNPPSLRLPGL
jgi:hypothetical protein